MTSLQRIYSLSEGSSNSSFPVDLGFLISETRLIALLHVDLDIFQRRIIDLVTKCARQYHINPSRIFFTVPIPNFQQNPQHG